MLNKYIKTFETLRKDNLYVDMIKIRQDLEYIRNASILIKKTVNDIIEKENISSYKASYIFLLNENPVNYDTEDEVMFCDDIERKDSIDSMFKFHLDKLKNHTLDDCYITTDVIIFNSDQDISHIEDHTNDRRIETLKDKMKGRNGYLLKFPTDIFCDKILNILSNIRNKRISCIINDSHKRKIQQKVTNHTIFQIEFNVKDLFEMRDKAFRKINK